MCFIFLAKDIGRIGNSIQHMIYEIEKKNFKLYNNVILCLFFINTLFDSQIKVLNAINLVT